jgi:hypothetical protein
MLGHRWSVRAFRLGAMLCVTFGASACTTPPPPAPMPASADPYASVPASRYRSVTAGAESFRPVESKPWQNPGPTAAPPDKRGTGQ